MHELKLAVRNVLRQQRRSAVAFIAIAAGVAALVFAGGFIDWILRELREQTIRSQLGHIQVGAKAKGSGSVPARLPANGPALAHLAHLTHVAIVAPRLALSGLVSVGDATLAFVGEGIEPEVDPTAGRDDVVDGQPLSGRSPQAVLLGEGLAQSLDAAPGAKAVLLVNLPNGGIHASDVTITGLFRTASKAFDDVALRVPLALARQLLGTQATDVWIVMLDDTANTQSVLEAMRADPELAGLEFTPWFDLADFYNKAVVLYARQFAVMEALIAIIIVLSIMNTLSMSVSERTWEIGTMMAIGTPRRAILRLFVAEGLVLGIIGGGAGVALGLLVNAAASAIGIPMPPPPGMRHGFLAGASFDAGMALSAFALAVVATTAASIIPAFAASRLVIANALRAAR